MRETLDSGERRDFETGAKRDVADEKQSYEFTLDQWEGMLKQEQGVVKFKPLDIDISRPVKAGDFKENKNIRSVPIFWDKIKKCLSFSRGWYTRKPQGFILYSREGIPVRCFLEPLMINRLQGLMERGAYKYSEDNWRLGMPLSVYFNSAMRHLLMWFFGDRKEDHLAAVIFNVQCIMVIEKDLYEGVTTIPIGYADAGLLKYNAR